MERTRALRRIIALQNKVKTLAEVRFAAAEAHAAALTADREALQLFVDGANLSGAMALLAIKRTRGLAVLEKAADERRAELQGVRQKAETKLKLAERVGDAVAREETAAAERRALERLIEEAVGRPTDEDDQGPSI